MVGVLVFGWLVSHCRCATLARDRWISRGHRGVHMSSRFSHYNFTEIFQENRKCVFQNDLRKTAIHGFPHRKYAGGESYTPYVRHPTAGTRWAWVVWHGWFRIIVNPRGAGGYFTFAKFQILGPKCTMWTHGGGGCYFTSAGMFHQFSSSLWRRRQKFPSRLRRDRLILGGVIFHGFSFYTVHPPPKKNR